MHVVLPSQILCLMLLLLIVELHVSVLNFFFNHALRIMTYLYTTSFFFVLQQPNWGLGSLIVEDGDHTQLD